MTTCRIAPLATADLDEIWDYVAGDSPSVADRLLDALRERFLLLATHPLLGELRPELGDNLRSFSAGQHVIYYQVIRGRVRVARVLHGSRDVTGLVY